MADKTRHKYLDDQKFALYNGTLTRVGAINDYLYTRIGSSLPHYEAIIKEGKSATTPLTVEVRDRLIDQGAITRVWADGREENQTWCGFSHSVPYSTPSSFKAETARSIAAVKVRGKIHDESSAYSGLQFLGELRETLHMIKHPAEAAFALTNKFARNASNLRQKRKVRKITKRDFSEAIAGSWLEFAFGLQPLVDDITAIAAAALPMQEDIRIVRLTGSGVDYGSSSESQENGDFGLANISRIREAVSTYKHKYVVGFRREVQASNNSLRQVYDQGAFKFSEIIPTAWELLPWSFFIDYFSNIGDCINADLVSLENVVWSSSSAVFTYDELHHSFAIRDAFPYLGTTTFSEQPLYSSRYTRVTRTGDMPDFPSLRFQLPGATKQFLNIAALAALVFPK
ncbi:TPA_asm: maturation protein [ssRNA phage SRR7976299_2]|uniref:Maturation protein n=1 Tax=ssRNA phage SRR7976299_2 TaxID=2786642 RepID=A0A8S5L4Q6_9VIRU|nr:maturation protein [ssRNA phage SRR7976299_2]DAD52665.1 TPA_asm: maturation protein [ssRNA phage SRR7976299_2]